MSAEMGLSQEEHDKMTELRNLVELLTKRVQDAEERAAGAEQRAAAAEEEAKELRQEVAELRQQTELVDRVQRASTLKPDERAIVLIQTLHAEARRNGGTATIDASAAVKALGGDVDRTLMYGEDGTFERTVDLVGDEDLLWYKKENRASSKNSRLILDLNNGEMPEKVAGHDITEVRK